MGGRGPWGLGRSSRKPLPSRSESMYPCCRYLRSLSMGKECSVRAKEAFVKSYRGIVRVDRTRQYCKSIYTTYRDHFARRIFALAHGTPFQEGGTRAGQRVVEMI